MSFLTELKRRNVYRVAVLYVVSSWLILQITDVIMSVLEIPGWAGKLIFLLIAAGFPIALILAWAFELTPGGVVRDQGQPLNTSAPRSRRSKVDYLIVTILLVAIAYFAWNHDWLDGKNQPGPQSIRSIVVLPFENLMNDPEQAYFVSGMHEALILELSRLGALRVISKTSAQRFRGSNKSIPQIASELNVEGVIEGSVLRAGNTVRITVQLIDTSKDQPVWSETLDRELEDILGLYAEVTREISRNIHLQLTEEEQSRMTSADQVDPEVYQLYLKGRYLCGNWSPEEMAEGVKMLEKAIALQPENALMHAQIGLCRQYSAFFGYIDPLDSYEASMESASKALALNDRLPEAHVAMAGVQYYLYLRPSEALESLQKALTLDPKNVQALLHQSWLLGESGMLSESLIAIRAALMLDPLSTSINHALGQALFLNGETDRALDAYRKSLELDRSDPSLHWSVGWALEAKGDFTGAVQSHNRAVELSGGAALYKAFLAHSLGVSGDKAAAKAILEEFETTSTASPFELAIVYLGLGAHEQAMDNLEKAFEARDSYIIYINQAPMFDPLRKSQRFKDLNSRFEWPD